MGFIHRTRPSTVWKKKKNSLEWSGGSGTGGGEENGSCCPDRDPNPETLDFETSCLTHRGTIPFLQVSIPDFFLCVRHSVGTQREEI